ncbi:MAG: response regulator transcription factor [Bacteroidales bacterium]|nr:response regulator transcription factor [Bacteroidales bacterium]
MQNKHILVVEDDDMSFIYINQILNLSNYKTARVKTGIDAIEYCRSGVKPDLILLDIQLPDMDGKKASIEIRKYHDGIPIIAQTASQIGDQREQLLEAGIDDLIIKPFAVEELLEKIEKYIG